MKQLSAAARLSSLLRDVPDFPRPGILFKDITPLLQDPEGLRLACTGLAEPFFEQRIDVVVGIESRGFVFGAPVALLLGAGFAVARKVGKLPAATVRASYALEYGSAEIEMHRDSILPGQRVLLVDDVIATGGTAAATVRLVREMGGRMVGAAFLIELGFLNGRQALENVPIEAVLRF